MKCSLEVVGALIPPFPCYGRSMTARDVITARLWAVIDRPYKGTSGTSLSVTRR